MKRCPKCERTKPDNEYRTINRKAGTKLASYCRPCEREYLREYRTKNRDRLNAYRAEYHRDVMSDPKMREARREYHREKQREWRENNPEKVREQSRRRWQQLKADPQKYAEYLELARLDRRERMMRQGREVKTGQTTAVRAFDESIARAVDLLPTEPICAWIRQKLDEDWTLEGLAGSAGQSSRSVRRWLSGESDRADVRVVEALLAAEGGTALAELYPEYLEAAA